MMTKRSGGQHKENEEKHIVGIFDNISVEPGQHAEIPAKRFRERDGERERE